MNCTFQIQGDRAEAWVPTQAPQWSLSVIAQIAKLPPEKVTVHTTLMGGGFGLRHQADFVMEAAVAKAAGKPVMILWTREDDMRHDFYRPASYRKLTGARDARGNLAAWKHFRTSTSTAARWDESGTEHPEQSESGAGATVPHATANIPAADSSWRASWTSWPLPPARTRWHFA